MPVSRDLQCLFVHVPKTAGTSIETALDMHGPWEVENREMLFGLIQSPDLVVRGFASAFLQHLSMKEIDTLPGNDERARYFSFSFVRNPWDRMISEYHHVDPHLARQARAAGIELEGLSFAEFLARSGEIHHAHLETQAHFLCDDEGAVMVDFVGRYETLETDFSAVCRQLGVTRQLPRLNTRTRGDYRGYYDERCRRMVAERYRADVKTFGYEF